jgi:cytoskeletal protein CcmA (bactofilin family)
MLSSFKSKAADQDRNTATNADELVGRTVEQSLSLVEQVASGPEPTATTKPGPDSCIGSDMSIVGKIDCKGPAQVFGRIEGELRASDLLVGDGAQVEGSVIAQNVTICGRIKGTIRALRVRLQNGGAVEGDIFHRSLSIDENSLFEGSSRRVENPTEIPSGNDAKVPQTKDIQSPTPTSNLDGDLQRAESALSDCSESTVESRH